MSDTPLLCSKHGIVADDHDCGRPTRRLEVTRPKIAGMSDEAEGHLVKIITDPADYAPGQIYFEFALEIQRLRELLAGSGDRKP